MNVLNKLEHWTTLSQNGLPVTNNSLMGPLVSPGPNKNKSEIAQDLRNRLKRCHARNYWHGERDIFWDRT